MVKPIALLIFSCLILLTSCQDSVFKGNMIVTIKESRPEIIRVKVENDQLIVTGTNLDKVTIAKVEGSTNHQFSIESKSSNQLVLNAKSALNFLVGQTLNLIVSNAQAAATFPISFELQNGQVTAAKLHHMGASAGQYLRFNGTTWAPSSISSSQVFAGAYDAATDSPDIVSIGGSSGTYYIVTVAGTQDLGSGSESFDVGDWVIFNGSTWSRLAVGTNTVSGFNGRTGLVVPLAGDYSWSMLTKAAGKLTGSKVSEIADVDVTGIQDGDILQWNAGNTKWEVIPVPTLTITAGSITNTQIASGAIDSSKIVDGSIVNADVSATAAIDQSKINGLTTALSGKEPSITAGTAAQYWSGNKTWQNLNPAVIGSTLTGFSSTTGAITSADTILSAVNKLTGNLGVTAASQANYVLKAGDTMSGPLAMGNNKITGLATPTVGTDAATKDYVDTKAGTASQWTTVGSNIHYNTGSVGVGTSTPEAYLHVASPNYPPAMMERTSTTHTNSRRAGLYVLASTTQDMVDGFGSHVDFGVRDSSGVNNMLGSVGALRSGADNSGSLYFMTNNLGSALIHMTIDNLGRTGLGTTTPTEKLDVVGNLALSGKVRLKSDTVNYVELQAPAGLAGSLNFRLPATAGNSGQALTTDGAGNLSWAAVSSGAIADGSVGYAKLNLADGDVPLAKLAGASDATKYLKGNKTWGTFITDVLASTFATVTPANTVIANGDSLQTVVNKTQGQINQLKTDAGSYLTKNGTDSITGAVSVTGAGSLKIPTTPSGADLTDVANVQYVQNYVDTFGQWSKNGSALYTNNSVGIGHNNPTTGFHMVGTGGGNDDVLIDSYFDGSGESALILRRSRGTSALPTAALADDSLGFLSFRGYSGSAFVDMARVKGAAETDLASSLSGNLQFWTRNNGTYTEKMRLTSAGNVGIGTINPYGPLEVAKDVTSPASMRDSAAIYFGGSPTTAGKVFGWLGVDQAGSGTAMLGVRKSGASYGNLSLVPDGGNVGIGTTSPTSTLEVASDASASIRGVTITHTSASNTPSLLIMRKSRGTITSPTATLLNDHLGYIAMSGHDGTNYVLAANPTGILASASENWSATGNGGFLRFYTTANGALDGTERMRISHDGNVGIGVTTNPAAKLQIQGNSTADVSSYLLNTDDTGTASRSLFLFGTAASATRYGYLSHQGAGYTANGALQPRTTVIAGTDTGGLNLLTNTQIGFWVGPSEIMRVHSTGNVGIGTSAPSYKLHVNGSVAGVGAYNALSDRRFKKDFEKIPDALEKIVKLNGFYYHWKQQTNPEMQFEQGRDMGVIAQEVEKVFPEAVSTAKGSGIKSVAYSKLIAPLIEAFKNLHQMVVKLLDSSEKHSREIASIKEENKLLKAKSAQLEQENAAFKAYLCQKDPKAAFCK